MQLFPMKIKPPSKKNLRRAKLKASAIHWWLVPEKPKKTYRLKQLNKHNRRVKSEFILMAEVIENDPTRRKEFVA